jgi:hypothetical protein
LGGQVAASLEVVLSHYPETLKYVVAFENLDKMRRLIVRLIFANCLIFSLLAADADSVVGAVKSTQGNTVIRRGAQDLPGQEGMHLIVHDMLRTMSDGRLAVILQDGTRLSFGSNTEVKIDEFVYQPVDGRFALLLRIAHGAMSYISGKIAQFSPESVKVETPVGVVGLRGTHFAISLEEK